jgi:hypothetical protein
VTDRSPDHPRLKRVYWNLRLFGLPEPIRDLWLFAITGLLVLALISIQGKADTAKLRADQTAIEAARQRDGRRIAIESTCSIEQGVIDAGRDQLLRFGQAKAAARYGRTVARAIERQAHVTGLIDPATGRLRCERLVRVSGAK